ncbi:MAG: hypothetical protein AAGJ50_11030 [Pseudomonadota bacterium]
MRTFLSATLLASTMLAGPGNMLLGAQPAFAQDPAPQDPLAGTIRSVVVEGNQRIVPASGS